ncbi:D-alanyl-D-alanine carboxypeptidase family protein [Cellulomonas cellasea]|uniref:D-alanyl-D-alanine carboxypeptidase-like core domain-containing protein n=1 Tax=Cellulomonas cellasea TaxID=43670 RepID=A0A7W4UEY2_9CELL|nr:D-alanyl-D-alanine carboxypeptidase family protein [Cellulomonas cellasea]MBB2922963.1 hypothetical protein [Cellulomonas cellasea]
MGSDPLEPAPAAPVSRRQLREAEKARQAALAAAAAAAPVPSLAPEPTRTPRGTEPAVRAGEAWGQAAPVATLAVPRGTVADEPRLLSRATSPDTARVLHRGPAGSVAESRGGPVPSVGAAPQAGPSRVASRASLRETHAVDETRVVPRTAAADEARGTRWTNVGDASAAPRGAVDSATRFARRPAVEAPHVAGRPAAEDTRVPGRAAIEEVRAAGLAAVEQARVAGRPAVEETRVVRRGSAPEALAAPQRDGALHETHVVPRTPAVDETRVVPRTPAVDETRVVPRTPDADTTHVIPATVDEPAEHDGPAASDAHVVPVRSRRAARSSEPGPARVKRSAASEPARGIAHGPRGGTWAARTGVVAALLGVTVVVPVVENALPGGGDFGDPAVVEAELPDTVEALTASTASGLPPASLVSADASPMRSELSASRSEEREPLPGCDGATRAAGANGLLATEDLCTLWEGKTQLRADAAVSLAVLNQAFIARFGVDMCLSSGYRTLAQQRSVKAQKGGLAAAPGKSNHGWGLAVDLCSSETTGAKWTWLNENAPSFGWDNPAWARPGGSGPYERWHWEYTKGVQEDGEFYG